MIQRIILFLLFISSAISQGQINERFWIHGKVIDSAGIVKDVHVVNLTSKTGTFTNDFGDYKIVVSIGDTLQFTSVSHQTVKRKIIDFNFTNEVLDVFLPIKTVELDEIELKRNDLSGFISLDIKRTPIDRRAEALKRNMDFSKIDIYGGWNNDYINTRVKPPIASVDPTRRFAGIGGSFGGGKSDRKRERIKRLTSSKFSRDKIYDICGKEFFEKLKIPKKEVLNFIDYCVQVDIVELYDKDLVLELAIVLEEKAPDFLKTLKP